jgi:ribonuclease P protein component
MNDTFPKVARIRRRSEFRRVYDNGTPQRNAGFHLFVAPSPDAHDAPARTGITATKRAGNAVVRNRLRRWVREYVRRNRRKFTPGVDIVINVHPRMAKADHEEFDRLLANVFSKAQILQPR